MDKQHFIKATRHAAAEAGAGSLLYGPDTAGTNGWQATVHFVPHTKDSRYDAYLVQVANTNTQDRTPPDAAYFPVNKTTNGKEVRLDLNGFSKRAPWRYLGTLAFTRSF